MLGAGGTGGGAAPRTEAITHREALEAAGIDANAPTQVFHRMFCKGTRARNIAMLLIAVLLCTLAVTTRANENRRYLIAPARAFAEDAHLESHHWTHFRHGAPVILAARTVDDILRRETIVVTSDADTTKIVRTWTPSDKENDHGTAALLRQLSECVADPDAAINGTGAGNAAEKDEDGFVVAEKAAAARIAALQTAAGIGNLRVGVDPIVIDPSRKDALHAQQAEGRHVTRRLQWDRIIFMVYNVSSPVQSDPAVRCLTYLQASALFLVDGVGDWFCTHGGLHPPTPAHHVSVALPQADLGPAEAVAASASAKEPVLSRFNLLLSPRPTAASNAKVGHAKAKSGAVAAFAWWAAQRVRHTPADDGIVLVAPPSARAEPGFTPLEDAIRSRWYHEHHGEGGVRSKLFKGTPVKKKSEPAAAAASPDAKTLVNPIEPALTVALGTDGSLIGPVTVLNENTAPSRVPMLLVTRTDGFGVYRTLAAAAQPSPAPATTADAAAAPTTITTPPATNTTG